MVKSNLGKIGDGVSTANASWKFDKTIVKIFDKHITKSVPFYIEGQQLVTQISDYFIKEDSICYELGCSTGSLTYKLATRNKNNKLAK